MDAKKTQIGTIKENTVSIVGTLIMSSNKLIIWLGICGFALKLKKIPIIADNDDAKAVDNISFECSPGKIFGLIGPNGAGKTTTLRMIATMLKPTSGSISISGFDTIHNAQEVRKQIGFMTGQTALYDRLTPTEMVKYISDLHGIDHNIWKRKNELFSSLDMTSFAERRIGQLSTGMKQKTSIVRTIIHDPPVMIFDEPTSGLDIMTSRAIMDLIRRCKRKAKL